VDPLPWSDAEESGGSCCQSSDDCPSLDGPLSVYWLLSSEVRTRLVLVACLAVGAGFAAATPAVIAMSAPTDVPAATRRLRFIRPRRAVGWYLLVGLIGRLSRRIVARGPRR